MSQEQLSIKIMADASSLKSSLSEIKSELGGMKTNFADTFKSVGTKMTEIGGNLTKKVTLPIVGVGAAATKLGIDFEASMSEVQAVTGASAEEMEVLEKAARDAGATTNKSARDAADGLKYMGLAGWSVEESQRALMPMLKLSSAGNMELGRTSDLVTDSMSALGLGIDDIDSYLDLLAQTSRNSNTDIDALGEAFVQVGGRLNLLGVDTNEAAVALGILGDNGIKGSEAGRGLNAILTNLTAPTGQAKKALEELGVSAFDSNGEFIGIEETLKLVEASMEGMTQEQKNQYMSMIAGKEHGKTFNAMLGSLGEGWDSLSGKVANSDGALDEMYDTMTNNTMGSIDNLKSALEELGLKIWDNLKPSIDWLVEKLQGLTDKFNSLSPAQQENIVKIGLLVAAVGPLISILGKTSQNISSMITLGSKLAGSWGTIKGVGSALAGGLKATVGFIFSPAGAIMIGIAAVIAIGVLLYKNWDTIKEHAQKLWDKMKQIFTTMKDGVVKLFTAMGDHMKKTIETAKDVISKILEALKKVFETIFEAIKTVVVTIFNYIKDTIQDRIELATKIVTTTLNILKTVFETIFEAIKKVVLAVFNYIKDTIQDRIELASKIIKTTLDIIKTVFTTIFETIKNIVMTVFNHIKDTIESRINLAKSIITTALDLIKSIFSGRFGDAKNIVINIFDSIKNAISDKINAARDAVRTAIDKIKGFFNFKWSLPKLKLPKISITGKFSLSPPSVPKFGINWNARGAIFKKPTVLANGQGVGDASNGFGSAPEVVAPLSDLKQMLGLDEGKKGDTIINLHGNYGFRDKEDMDYFMNELALASRRG